MFSDGCKTVGLSVLCRHAVSGTLSYINTNKRPLPLFLVQDFMLLSFHVTLINSHFDEMVNLQGCLPSSNSDKAIRGVVL